MTIRDLRTDVGAGAARRVASALARKGVLQRVGRGVYLVRPLRSLLHPTRSSAPFVVAALLQDEPYFLGGRWALTQHGLTEQQNVSVMDAFVTRERPSRLVAGARVAFHVLPRRSMDHGVTHVTVEGAQVRVSDLERTLLDLLDHPRTVGGLRNAVEIFVAGLPRARIPVLVGHAILGSRTATCQRLGSILERRGAARSQLRRLEPRVARTRSMLSLVPGRRTGTFNRRWKVVENDDGLVAASVA